MEPLRTAALSAATAVGGRRLPTNGAHDAATDNLGGAAVLMMAGAAGAIEPSSAQVARDAQVTSGQPARSARPDGGAGGRGSGGVRRGIRPGHAGRAEAAPRRHHRAARARAEPAAAAAGRDVHRRGLASSPAVPAPVMPGSRKRPLGRLAMSPRPGPRGASPANAKGENGPCAPADLDRSGLSSSCSRNGHETTGHHRAAVDRPLRDGRDPAELPDPVALLGVPPTSAASRSCTRTCSSPGRSSSG